MGLLVGIDLGTSSVKVTVLDESQKVVASAKREYGIETPRPGWAEQDPEFWWSMTCQALGEALDGNPVHGRMVDAVGVTGQMHGLVALDSRREPLRPAIIWPDTRSTDECAILAGAVSGRRLESITGIAAYPGMLAPSILWLRRHEPDQLAATSLALLPKDYLRLKLTGEVATDPTDASGTLLFDTTRSHWSEPVLVGADIDPVLLPPVMASDAIGGRVTGDAATATGLRAGTPVAIGAGDQMAGALAIGVTRPGTTAAVMGTGGQLITSLSSPLIDKRQRLQTFRHVLPDTWLLMGAVQSASLSIAWLTGVLGAELGGTQQHYLLEQAAQVPPGSDGLIFLPYLTGVRTPHLDPDARGCFVGLDLSHGPAHLTRAVLEGVAFAMRDALTAFREVGVDPGGIICSGGGARSTLWAQLQADVYGQSISFVADGEHSAHGAALIAGVAAGHFSSVHEAAAHPLPIMRTIQPSSEVSTLYDRLYSVTTQLYGALSTTYRALAEMRAR